MSFPHHRTPLPDTSVFPGDTGILWTRSSYSDHNAILSFPFPSPLNANIYSSVKYSILKLQCQGWSLLFIYVTSGKRGKRIMLAIFSALLGPQNACWVCLPNPSLLDILSRNDGCVLVLSRLLLIPAGVVIPSRQSMFILTGTEPSPAYPVGPRGTQHRGLFSQVWIVSEPY